MSKKLLTVFGATGNQGGSVISVILGSKDLSSKYALRAITRDTSKPNAQALASKGVELAKADLNDPDSIATAIKGSYGVFAVTNYWETMDKDIEFNQGKNIIEAVKAEGVKHLVWSGLPHVGKLTNDEFTLVEHFESKADVTELGNKVKGDSFIFSTFMPGFFMSNLPGQIKRQENGEIGLSLPWDGQKTWVPLIDIRADTGKYVAGLFEAGPAGDGVAVQGVSEWAHPDDILSKVSEISGQEVKFIPQPLTVEITKTLDKVPGELAQNMLFIRDYSYYGKGTEQKQTESDKFLPEGTEKRTWDAFAKEQKWAF